MDAQQGTEKFREADALFKQGEYARALQLLDELNRAYPNEKRLLYAMALSLGKLGRRAEALQTCNRILERYDHPRTQRLKERLMRGGIDQAEPAPPPPPALESADTGEAMSFDQQLDGPSAFNAPPPPPPPPEAASNWPKYLLIGAVVLVGVVLVTPLGMLLVKGGGGELPTLEDPDAGSGLLLLFCAIAIGTHLLHSWLAKLICEKAGEDPGCIIWIPLLQIIPLWQLARLSGWWIVAFFVPVVNAVAGIIVPVLLFMGLCQAREKSPVIGLLAILPGGYFLVMVYLAFSE